MLTSVTLKEDVDEKKPFQVKCLDGDVGNDEAISVELKETSQRERRAQPGPILV